MHWAAKRILTASVAIPVVASLVYIPLTVPLVVIFVVCLALVEYWKLADHITEMHRPSLKRWLLGLICGAASALGLTGSSVLVGIATTVAASIVAITSISEVLDAVKARGSKAEKNIWKAGFPAVAMDVFGVWYIAWLFSHAGLLMARYGFGHIACVLASSWIGDTGALVLGRALGGAPMAPAMSPAKTWEGCLGQLLTSIATSITCGLLVPVPLATPHLAAVGAMCSLGSILGDLFESIIKRAAGQKDSGTFFPGHGGMLDRLDSLILAFVFVFGYLELCPVPL